MFPETDELSYIFSNTAMVLFKRRLVDRVPRVWLKSVREGQFPRREQIELSMLDEDQANCLVIAVQSPDRVLTCRRYWGKLIICALPQR